MTATIYHLPDTLQCRQCGRRYRRSHIVEYAKSVAPVYRTYKEEGKIKVIGDKRLMPETGICTYCRGDLEPVRALPNETTNDPTPPYAS